jgi:hypothetical protein
MAEILLRPHHGLCIRFFKGKGYSDEFTAHMRETIEILRREETKLILTDREDAICASCPNFTANGCNSREKVETYDRRVLELTGLKPGNKMTFSYLQQQIGAHIIESGQMKNVCRDCGWADICHTTHT